MIMGTPDWFSRPTKDLGCVTRKSGGLPLHKKKHQQPGVLLSPGGEPFADPSNQKPASYGKEGSPV